MPHLRFRRPDLRDRHGNGQEENSFRSLVGDLRRCEMLVELSAVALAVTLACIVSVQARRRSRAPFDLLNPSLTLSKG